MTQKISQPYGAHAGNRRRRQQGHHATTPPSPL